MLWAVNDVAIAGDVARSPPAAIRDDFSRILEGGRPEKLGPLLHPDAAAAERCWSWQLMQQLDVMRAFPTLFSLTCLVMFSMPIGIAYHLGLDEDVRYWGDGPMCGTALWLPLIFILAFYVHDRLQRPHKATIVISLLVPSVTLLLIGNELTAISAQGADQLFSADCDTSTDKRRLENSWQAAQSLFSGLTWYMDCLQQTTTSHNLTLSRATELFRIQDCTEYAAAFPSHKDWQYLRFVEEEHKCAGWCSFGRKLWTDGEGTDSCSTAVAQVLRSKVRRPAQQVVALSALALIGSAVGLVAVAPTLHLVFDW
mmetsp:Transcript_45917/g.147544  ORF Transcript_45917/g.147544 Transcript_45917/m.147544 type:complete len:312 (+) Transcript_45917:173-1108(+)